MSHLGDDAEAFFQKGDEGTYEGGPRSLLPSTADATTEDELSAEVTPALLERRSRLQKIVTRIVGSLGAGVLILLPFRLGVGGGADQVPHYETREQAPRRLAPQPAPYPGIHSPAAPVAAAAAREATTPPASQVTPSGVKERPRRRNIRAAHAKGSARARRIGAAAHFQRSAGGRTNRFSSVRRASATHAPPTANFPD